MAKVFKPANTTHIMTFQPRYIFTGVVSLLLKNEATKVVTDVPNTWTAVKNGLIEMTFDFTFIERDKFQIKITEGAEVVYRGSIFATDQVTQDFKLETGYITY